MKKYFIKLSAVVLFLGVITGCDEKQVIYDGQPAVANFTTDFAQLNVLETTNGSVNIGVNVSNLSNTDREIVIDIDEEATTATESQYQIDGASLIIPANSYNGFVKVSGDFESLPAEGSVALVLNLKEVGDSSINIDGAQSTVTITIQRSCPFDASKVGVNFTGTSYVDEEEITTFIPVMVQSATNPNLFTVNSLWGTDFVAAISGNPAYDGLYIYGGTILINDDLTLTVTTKDSWATGATGTYNPCTNTFNYTLGQSLFQDPFPVNVILMPN